MVEVLPISDAYRDVGVARVLTEVGVCKTIVLLIPGFRGRLKIIDSTA